MYDKKENQTTTQTAEQKNPIQVADRLFAVIEELSKSGPTGLIELSNTLGLHKSTTHRLLTSLMYMDYVRQDEESGKYSLSFKLLEISSRILGHIDVLSTIHPYLKELADISGETVHLVKRDGLDVVYIDKVESSSNSVRMVSRVGSRTPMYRSGVGKALLAMMRPEEVRTIWGDSKIEALTEYTVTDLDELFIILEEARENGYALDNEENENGVRCIASSIMDYSGKPKYAFSISGPTVRMTDERILELSKLTLQTKKKLEEELGYHS